QPLLARDKFPCKANGIAFEIIAKRKIPEHFKERVMPRGVADVLEVVVLAAGAHAALAGGGAHVVALFLAQEHILELHHAGIGEEGGGVVGGHERARRHDGMAAFAEKFEVGAADFRRAHGAWFAQDGSSGSKSPPRAARI